MAANGAFPMAHRSALLQTLRQRLPGSMNLNRPLQVQRQRQRRPARAGRYKFNGNGVIQIQRQQSRRDAGASKVKGSASKVCFARWGEQFCY